MTLRWGRADLRDARRMNPRNLFAAREVRYMCTR